MARAAPKTAAAVAATTKVTQAYQEFPPEDKRLWIGPFVVNKATTDARALYRLREIADYFTPERLRHLRELSKRRKKDPDSTPSLRTIEFFIINYVKGNPLVLVDAEGQPFDIYKEYKRMLRDDRRVLCDPFRRGPRIFFRLPETPRDAWHTTTIGQVRNYHWITTTPLYDYFMSNREEIFRKMTTACRRRSRELQEERRATGRRPRRRELTRSAVTGTRSFQGHHAPNRVSMPEPARKRVCRRGGAGEEDVDVKEGVGNVTNDDDGGGGGGDVAAGGDGDAAAAAGDAGGADAVHVGEPDPNCFQRDGGGDGVLGQGQGDVRAGDDHAVRPEARDLPGDEDAPLQLLDRLPADA